MSVCVLFVWEGVSMCVCVFVCECVLLLVVVLAHAWTGILVFG